MSYILIETLKSQDELYMHIYNYLKGSSNVMIEIDISTNNYDNVINLPINNGI